MSVATRVFLAVAAGVVLVVTAAAGAGAHAVYRAGSIAVDVQPEEGGRVRLSVPAAIADLAVAFLPDELLEEVAGELEPVWPTLRAVSEELAGAPDFVLLEVSGRDEHVKIEKRSGSMRVEVEADGSRIQVEVPFETVRRLASRLDSGRASGT